MAAPYKAAPDHFLFGPVLGEGAFAKVFECVHTITGNKFAVKTVDKNFIKKNNKVDTVIRERNVLQLLNGHPGIIKLYFTFQDPFNLYYALELAPNGELLDQLSFYKRFPLAKVREYAIQLFEIIRYMHSKNVVHRDIKPSNILLSESGHLKLADFGTAKIVDPQEAEKALQELYNAENPYTTPIKEDMSEDVQTEVGEMDSAIPERKKCNSFVGTAQYVPPELLHDGHVTFSADWWAYGVLLYEMLTGKVPFAGVSEYHIFQAILSHNISFPEGFDPDAQDLITRLLNRDFKNRLGPQQGDIDIIANHPFFAAAGVNFSESAQSIFNRPAPEFHSFPDHEETEEASGSTGNTSTSATAASAAATTTGPAVAVAENYKLVGSDSQGKNLFSKYYQHLEKGEFIVFIGVVNKSGKWGRNLFRKVRLLILTSKPRLLYIDDDRNVTKGEIPFSGSMRVDVKPPVAGSTSGLFRQTFDIVTEDRTYDIKCEAAPYVSNSELLSWTNDTAPNRSSEAIPDREKEPFFISETNDWAVEWAKAIQKTLKN